MPEASCPAGLAIRSAGKGLWWAEGEKNARMKKPDFPHPHCLVESLFMRFEAKWSLAGSNRFLKPGFFTFRQRESGGRERMKIERPSVRLS